MVTSGKKDVHEPTKRFITKSCPSLDVKDVNWDKASHPDLKYNCVGYVAGNINGGLRWWRFHQRDADGIVLNPSDYWPKGVPCDETLESYMKALETVGFEECNNGNWEEGYEKIAIQFDAGPRSNRFGHVSKLIQPDVWDSKIGGLSDFTHSENALNGVIDTIDNTLMYGDDKRFMKRRIKAVASPKSRA